MNNKSPTERGIKQKTIHELREFIALSIYLAFFFCALTLYSMILLGKFHIEKLPFTFAVINALVVAKVILIGEYARVGTRYNSKSLFKSTVWKAFTFTLLVFAFHIVEEVLKDLVHGIAISRAYQETRVPEMLGRSLLVFCTFIPLFGFREFRRVLGEKEFRALVFGSGKIDKSALPADEDAKSDPKRSAA